MIERDAVCYSVIVPAYNAAGTIAACLQAMLDQSVSRRSYEVLVVDDGSTDDTGQIASRYPVRVLSQRRRGPASARNLGVRHAAGIYLLFTDADCVPTFNWIEELVRPMELDPRVVGVKGAYRTDQRSLIARFCQVEFEVKYERLRSLPSIDFIDTGSAALRKEAFWEGGGFDPSFAVASNEDTNLSFNLAGRGHRMVFNDKAIVFHRHSESLRSYLLRKLRHGYWRVRVYRKHPGKMAGDSYTPRSMQVQFVTAFLTLLLLALPGVRHLAMGAIALFVLSTGPFVRQAIRIDAGPALLAPAILFLRALALGLGLTVGFLGLLVGADRKQAERAETSKERLEINVDGGSDV